MKLTVLLILLSVFPAYSQLVSGDLIQEGRKLISTSTFKVTGSTKGVIYYELAVDREGNVTSDRLLVDKTTVASTPTRMRAKTLVRELKFEKGTYYPQFHHVVVKVTVE